MPALLVEPEMVIDWPGWKPSLDQLPDDRAIMSPLALGTNVSEGSTAEGPDAEGPDMATRLNVRSGVPDRATWVYVSVGAPVAVDVARRIGVIVPDTYTAIAVASRSDMAALVPRRIAQFSAQSGRVKLIEPPYASPSVQVNLVYLRDRLAEPATAWMRDLIRSVAAEI